MTIFFNSHLATEIAKNNNSTYQNKHKPLILAERLFPKKINRKCPHEKFVAKADDITPDEYDPDAKISIAYFLIVHGRSISQVLKSIRNYYVMISVSEIELPYISSKYTVYDVTFDLECPI